MNAGIAKAAAELRISRLCHFTPSRNLGHIAADRIGVLSTANLEADERKLFNPTDLKRLDGFKDRISCSVEYPNAWYFADAQNSQPDFFRDWVVLAIAPSYLWDDQTLFCPWNAARRIGIRPDLAGFNAMFAPEVRGRRRTPARLSCCPTDEQAEVLVADAISLDDVLAVIVRDEAQARRESTRLDYLGVSPKSFRWAIAPTLFDKYELHAALGAGRRPQEVLWASA